ncbi:MAG: hypothetical protein H7832_00210 [Magnetococcus sp. DMHC-6]
MSIQTAYQPVRTSGNAQTQWIGYDSLVHSNNIGMSPGAGKDSSVGKGDSITLFGMDSVKKAIEMLATEEPLPIPEAVGQAIDKLVKEVFHVSEK